MADSQNMGDVFVPMGSDEGSDFGGADESFALEYKRGIESVIDACASERGKGKITAGDHRRDLEKALEQIQTYVEAKRVAIYAAEQTRNKKDMYYPDVVKKVTERARVLKSKERKVHIHELKNLDYASAMPIICAAIEDAITRSDYHTALHYTKLGAKKKVSQIDFLTSIEGEVDQAALLEVASTWDFASMAKAYKVLDEQAIQTAKGNRSVTVDDLIVSINSDLMEVAREQAGRVYKAHRHLQKQKSRVEAGGPTRSSDELIEVLVTRRSIEDKSLALAEFKKYFIDGYNDFVQVQGHEIIAEFLKKFDARKETEAQDYDLAMQIITQLIIDGVDLTQAYDTNKELLTTLALRVASPYEQQGLNMEADWSYVTATGIELRESNAALRLLIEAGAPLGYLNSELGADTPTFGPFQQVARVSAEEFPYAGNNRDIILAYKAAASAFVKAESNNAEIRLGELLTHLSVAPNATFHNGDNKGNRNLLAYGAKLSKTNREVGRSVLLTLLDAGANPTILVDESQKNPASKEVININGWSGKKADGTLQRNTSKGKDTDKALLNQAKLFYELKGNERIDYIMRLLILEIGNSFPGKNITFSDDCHAPSSLDGNQNVVLGGIFTQWEDSLKGEMPYVNQWHYGQVKEFVRSLVGSYVGSDIEHSTFTETTVNGGTVLSCPAGDNYNIAGYLPSNKSESPSVVDMVNAARVEEAAETLEALYSNALQGSTAVVLGSASSSPTMSASPIEDASITAAYDNNGRGSIKIGDIELVPDTQTAHVTDADGNMLFYIYDHSTGSYRMDEHGNCLLAKVRVVDGQPIYKEDGDFETVSEADLPTSTVTGVPVGTGPAAPAVTNDDLPPPPPAIDNGGLPFPLPLAPAPDNGGLPLPPPPPPLDGNGHVLAVASGSGVSGAGFPPAGHGR